VLTTPRSQRWLRPGCAEPCGGRSPRCDTQPRRSAARRTEHWASPSLRAARG
jgi:hypothetical protein